MKPFDLARSILGHLPIGRSVGYLGLLYAALNNTDRLFQAESCQGRLGRLPHVHDRHHRFHGSGLGRWNILSMGLSVCHIIAIRLRHRLPDLCRYRMENGVSSHLTL